MDFEVFGAPGCKIKHCLPMFAQSNVHMVWYGVRACLCYFSIGFMSNVLEGFLMFLDSLAAIFCFHSCSLNGFAELVDAK